MVVDSQLQNRHLEMLVHASPKHFGMVAQAAENGPSSPSYAVHVVG